MWDIQLFSIDRWKDPRLGPAQAEKRAQALETYFRPAIKFAADIFLVGVGFHAMLANIETRLLFFGRNSQEAKCFNNSK